MRVVWMLLVVMLGSCAALDPAVCTHDEDCTASYYCDVEDGVCRQGSRDAGPALASSSSAASTDISSSGAATSAQSASSAFSSTSMVASSSSGRTENGRVFFPQVTRVVQEGVGALSIEVGITEAPSVDVVVPFTVTGSAGRDSDFSVVAGTVTITATQTSGFLPLTILDDALPEFDETIILTLGAPDHGMLGGTTVHTLTIAGNDDGESTPVPEVVSPAEGAILDVLSAHYSGWCEYGAALSITYGLAGEGFSTGNPAMVTCGLCDSGEMADCGTSPNSRGRFEFDVAFTAQGGERVVTIGQRDAQGNTAMVTHHVELVPRQQAYLKGMPVYPDRRLGALVAADDGVIVATGAGTLADGGIGQAPDAIWFFEERDGGWVQAAVLADPQDTGIQSFAASVAVRGGRAFVGAVNQSVTTPLPDGGVNIGFGVVHEFSRDVAGGWNHVGSLRSASEPAATGCGTGIAVSDRHVAIGCSSDNFALSDGGKLYGVGAVHVYDRQSQVFIATLRPSDPVEYMFFGSSLALGDGRLFVGSTGDPSNGRGVDVQGTANSEPGAGSVAVYDVMSAGAPLQHVIRAPTSDACDGFGAAIAVDHGTLAVTAASDDLVDRSGPAVCDETTGGPGAVHIYISDGSTWVHTSTITSPDVGGLGFGASVALGDGTLLVHQIDPATSSDGGVPLPRESGQVHVFHAAGPGLFSRLTTLQPAVPLFVGSFGYSTAVLNGLLVVGYPGEASGGPDDPPNTSVPNSGAVLLYR